MIIGQAPTNKNLPPIKMIKKPVMNKKIEFEDLSDSYLV